MSYENENSFDKFKDLCNKNENVNEICSKSEKDDFLSIKNNSN